MTTSLALAMAWLVLANVIGMIPSKRKHWPQAYVLIAIGVPILVYVVIDTGWLAAMLVLVAAASILRWPVRYLMRWAAAKLADLRTG